MFLTWRQKTEGHSIHNKWKWSNLLRSCDQQIIAISTWQILKVVLDLFCVSQWINSSFSANVEHPRKESLQKCFYGIHSLCSEPKRSTCTALYMNNNLHIFQIIYNFSLLCLSIVMWFELPTHDRSLYYHLIWWSSVRWHFYLLTNWLCMFQKMNYSVKDIICSLEE